MSEQQLGSVDNENGLVRSPARTVCRDLKSCFQNASPKDILAIPPVEQRSRVGRIIAEKKKDPWLKKNTK